MEFDNIVLANTQVSSYNQNPSLFEYVVLKYTALQSVNEALDKRISDWVWQDFSCYLKYIYIIRGLYDLIEDREDSLVIK